jgi:hypothetical protein
MSSIELDGLDEVLLLNWPDLQYADMSDAKSGKQAPTVASLSGDIGRLTGRITKLDERVGGVENRIRTLKIQPSPSAAPIALKPESWTRNQKLTLAGIIVAGLVGAGGVITVYERWSLRDSAKQETNLDDHIDKRIARPGGVLEKLDTIISRLNRIEGWKEGIEGQVRILKQSQTDQQQEQQRLQNRLGQQEALNRLQDPKRILATIRAEVQMAESTGTTVPDSQLADYKNAVHSLPSTAFEYWVTVATIINYQSFLNQMNGVAPDPTKIVKPCSFGITGGHGNRYINMLMQGCVVDLDTQDFENNTFTNCVIRYRGAPTKLVNVRFINCRFIFEIAAAGKAPAAPKLLLSVLDSTDQISVKISG